MVISLSHSHLSLHFLINLLYTIFSLYIMFIPSICEINNLDNRKKNPLSD